MELSPRAAALENASFEVLGTDSRLTLGGALERIAAQLQRLPQGELRAELILEERHQWSLMLPSNCTR